MDMKVPENIKELHQELQTAHAAMEKGIKEAAEVSKRAEAEITSLKTVTSETAHKMVEAHEEAKKLRDAYDELKDRVKDIEQAGNRRGGGGDRQKSTGEVFVESEAFLASQKARVFTVPPVRVPSMSASKAAIINATGQNQPLVPAYRFPDMVVPERIRLTVRDLFTQIRVNSNAIEWPQLTSFTNNAGPQYDTTSPTPGQEGAVKPESAMAFQLNTIPVTTVAHTITASRQVLSDAPFLRDIIDSELRFGLKVEEEDELLNGNGTNGQLNGIKNNDTDFTGGVTNASAIDTILRAITQVRLAYFEPEGVIMHPTNWQDIALLKDAEGRYIFGNPHSMLDTSIWGIPVVVTAAQTVGEFTLGAFRRFGFIADREEMTIRISEHNADNFVRNLITILCEERIAFVPMRSAAVVSGNLSNAG